MPETVLWQAAGKPGATLLPLSHPRNSKSYIDPVNFARRAQTGMKGGRDGAQLVEPMAGLLTPRSSLCDPKLEAQAANQNCPLGSERETSGQAPAIHATDSTIHPECPRNDL